MRAGGHASPATLRFDTPEEGGELSTRTDRVPCHLDLMSLIYIGDSCRLMSTDVAIGRLLSTNVESRPTNVESRPTNVESRPTNVDRVRQKSRHVDKVAFCLFVSAQRKSGHLDLYGLSRYLYDVYGETGN